MELIWADHIVFILIGLIIPALSMASHNNDEDVEIELPPKKHIYYSNGLMLIIGALVLVTIWNLTGREWSKLGFDLIKPSQQLIYFIVGFILLYVIDTLISYRKSKTIELKKDLFNIMPSNWNDYRHFIFLALCAGVCEEIVFRGFMINYVKSFLHFEGTFTNLIAVIVPSIAFAVAHLYQGWLNVVKIFSFSILFGLIYIVSESLIIVIAIHIGVDLVSGLLLVKLGKQKP